MNLEDWKCPVPGCTFKPKVTRAIGGHIAGHKRRGELPKESITTSGPSRFEVAKPAPEVPNAGEIAEALLNRVVKIIADDELKDQVVKQLKSKVSSLEQDVEKVTQERDRILKLHNDQVKGHAGLPTSDELLRMARQPKER